MGYGKQWAEVNVSPVRPAQRCCRDVLLCHRHPRCLTNACIKCSICCLTPVLTIHVSPLYATGLNISSARSSIGMLALLPDRYCSVSSCWGQVRLEWIQI